MARREAGPCERWQRRSRESWKTTLGSRGTKPENWHSDSLKKVKLTFSQGKKKKGNEITVDEDDDALRTSVSQDRVAATLGTEELFFSTQYILLHAFQMGNHVGCGVGYGQSTRHIQQPSWVSHLPAGPYHGLQDCKLNLNYQRISLNKQQTTYFDIIIEGWGAGLPGPAPALALFSASCPSA